MGEPQSSLEPALRAAVNDVPPHSITRLPAQDQQRLAVLLADSRQQQQARLQQALKSALGHLPRLLRAPVRRALFPKGDV
ncbi:MAG: hypothetical protein RIK00_08060 [Algiphilus sp.]|uniref:hypothetical protein n=1 Tax=Algiphilus sp. TaxID=1872431 RepID=UPI0032EEA0D5